jgi:hypothetical protein
MLQATQQRTPEPTTTRSNWFTELAIPAINAVAQTAVIGAAVADLSTTEASKISNAYARDLQALTEGFNDLSFDYLKAVQATESIAA